MWPTRYDRYGEPVEPGDDEEHLVAPVVDADGADDDGGEDDAA